MHVVMILAMKIVTCCKFQHVQTCIFGDYIDVQVYWTNGLLKGNSLRMRHCLSHMICYLPGLTQ